jgi:hypothetical protein
MICELCSRENVETTIHHLTPKEEGGTKLPTAILCIPCHKQIHALFTNQELALCLNTIDKLKENERISKYLKWIQKQPASSIIKIKKSNDKKQKQR